ncbi:hypothetical protein, partial [Mesorhizobium sp. M1C.F.Ca.ET.189.01.1.1]|uniref:hypothetical protein n=1 Tax=Mesorhizobium sp. M1C.F.Ca.ET.189.01.1.1 TaxID=2563925 RepID=UPI001AEEEF03
LAQPPRDRSANQIQAVMLVAIQEPRLLNARGRKGIRQKTMQEMHVHRAKTRSGRAVDPLKGHCRLI